MMTSLIILHHKLNHQLKKNISDVVTEVVSTFVQLSPPTTSTTSTIKPKLKFKMNRNFMDNKITPNKVMNSSGHVPHPKSHMATESFTLCKAFIAASDDSICGSK